MKLTIEVEDYVAARLAVLVDAFGPGSPATVEHVIGELIDHAQQGVYRPGSWERPWLGQAFGDDWHARLVPDLERLSADGRAVFDRPNAGGVKAEVDIDEVGRAPGPGNSAEHVS